MKRILPMSGNTSAHFQTSAGENLMEGAPSTTPLFKLNKLTVSDRPHILSQRAARRNRRASH